MHRRPAPVRCDRRRDRGNASGTGPAGRRPAPRRRAVARPGEDAASDSRIACIGGGHGLSAALRAARRLTPDVTAIVTVADDGGSSGVLRAQLGIPAPGDLRMAIAALSATPELEALIQYRFHEGELSGHPLGNLLIAALADLHRDFAKAVEHVARLAGVAGHVIPSTVEPVVLHATIDDREVRGQVAIAQGPAPVQRLWLDPPGAPGHPAALEALRQADLVVVGPGSLFTSVIAALLPEGVAEAASRGGRVALVLNLSEQRGETLGLDAVSHVAALRAHCPGLRIDAVIAHDGDADGIVRPLAIDEDALGAARVPLVRADLIADGPRHDAAKLAATLGALL